MKKVLMILVLLLVFPLTINAASSCDAKKHSEYADFSEYIKLDKSYSKSSGSYKVTLYNVVNGLYIMFEGKEYRPDSESKVVISNVNEGTNKLARVYGDDGCTTSVGTVLINTPYYNELYGSYLCDGYEDKIVYCSSQFTTIKVTKDLIKTAINDYNMTIKHSEKKEEEKKAVTFVDKLLDMAESWGLKLLLALVTSFGTAIFFNRKFKKIQHGI